MHMTVSGKTGERSSASNAYLRPVMDRPNLEVRTGCHATRVIFADADADADADAAADAAGKGGKDGKDGKDGAEPRAVGVEYLDKQSGETRTVLVDGGAGGAGGEVILSLGAIGSPHLLQLSGVGAKADLEAAGVPVLLDQVGQCSFCYCHPA